MNYTPNQLLAISTIDRNLQIIACAGSGKTQVISARIINILRQQGVTPANIVAFTFTDKAAGELKDRIYKLAGEHLGTTQGLAEMYVGTIHGYCLNLLQSPPIYRFLKYGVLTDVQQRLLIDRSSSQSGLTETPLLAGGKLERWKDSRLYQSVLGILGEGNVNLNLVPPGVQTAVLKYHDLRDRKRYLDYTTMIAEAVAEIQTNEELRTQLAAQVKYLVVDEYQDVNPLQEMLIQQFRDLGANICVVGDDDQTIYQWRGSDVANIITFTGNYPGVVQIPLADNFRSSVGIVQSARRVVEQNPTRLPKEMQSAASQDFQRGDILALTFQDPDQEAVWIVGKIQSLRGAAYRDKPDAQSRGLSYSDFSVLLRSVRNDAGPIVSALDAANIPYIVVGMNGLFDTDEVQVMRAVFYYMANFAPPGQSIYTRNTLFQLLSASNLALSPAQINAGLDFLDTQKAKLSNVMIQELILQRLYLDFLDKLALREEEIDAAAHHPGEGEIVYYNLGKFSQVISDYEQIHFHTPSRDHYSNFAGFLCYQAADYYPEGWQDKAFARPDAVQIMTVHQAKGMQWPVVFIPCLRRNRFPSAGVGGRSVWHVIPQNAVRNAARYQGSIDDERRLFYVALTRAEKYLFCSWSPLPDNRRQQAVSQFFSELTASEHVLTRDPTTAPAATLPPRPRREDITLPLTFSELKYYFECPYQFKLKFLYGFNPPIDQALGYGKSLHDTLAEIHAESIKGNLPTLEDVPNLVDNHLHLPYATDSIRANLRSGALTSISRYLRVHGDQLTRLEHAEKIIELKLQQGIVVNGRIDLIRRTDTGEIIIVDFKSDERAQAEEITTRQLHVYAVGYQHLTGTPADLIEVHNLDTGGANREIVDPNLVDSTIQTIVEAGLNLRQNHLPRLQTWCDKCDQCDHAGVCRTQPADNRS